MNPLKWDDGEGDKGLSRWSVYPEDSKAVNISEETGILFRTSVSFLSQGYIPESLSDKFPDVDREFYGEGRVRGVRLGGLLKKSCTAALTAAPRWLE